MLKSKVAGQWKGLRIADNNECVGVGALVGDVHC